MIARPLRSASRRSHRAPAALRGALAALAAVTAAGCGTARSVPGPPVRPGWSQEGIASWYGPEFHGRPTASGEAFDMEAMTAAHPTLPLGTLVRVTVLATGRRAELRVNDRGPFHSDRIVDVSRGAARRLGFLASGTARVRIEVVALPRDCWEVQVGSFAREENARGLRRRLRRAGEPARLKPGPEGFTRVIAGPYPGREEAAAVREDYGGNLGECSR